ncbi:hypothetical protein LV478_05655 [Komagataeibacter oboediens]|nr:hypothetical protein [Komagataeibacter oboediens]WEQ53017.1 hypothetical protein LV478_05655 [Komagataeibacter oboediens]GCE80820.1 hypothetical protein MSKU3_2295 [Komagataeibacter oboediens]
MQAVPPPMVRRLDPADVPLLYPLIRIALPHISMRDWIRIGRRLARSGPRVREGILVAHYGIARPPCAMATFRRGFDLYSGDTLTSDYIITLSYTQRQKIVDALIPAMETLARELGCDAIRMFSYSNRAINQDSPVRKLCSTSHITERTVRLDRNKEIVHPS